MRYHFLEPQVNLDERMSSTAATAISCIAVRCYKLNMLDDTSELLKDVDQIWRIIIGLGCVPGAIALYFRLTIPETPRFTMDIERNVQKATQDVDAFLTPVNYTVDPEVAFQRLSARTASKQDFQSYFSKWENLKVLLGTSYSWFALDVCVAFARDLCDDADSVHGAV